MPHVRLSAADWSFAANFPSPEQYYRVLKSLGYEAAEMVEPGRRAAAKAAGLRLLNIAGPSNLNRAHELEKNIAALKSAIADAAAAGLEQLIVFSGNRGQAPGEPAITDDAGRRACIAALKGAATEAERARLVMTLEVFNQFDHPDYQCDSGAFAFDVARGVSSPAVKVLYDLYHMDRMKEDVADQVVGNLSYVAHLHVAASPTRTAPTESSLPDYASIVRKIVAAGYRGFWGMEFSVRGDAMTELRESAALFQRWSGEPG
ncbi:MAG TPA: TIM barrel protein [Tepidisphaeraceae bacterium]|jgi:hydroxypyruvate isomerase|nr:TIM barrel protein [Tepidisphaeraceae bacterium]